MQYPRTLSLAALSLALLAGPLATSPAVADQEAPTAPQAAPAADRETLASTVLTREHTDALALSLASGQLDLFTYADLPGAPRTRLNPDQTVFNLQDRDETRLSLPAGFDFLGAEGSTIWLAPQTQVAGVLWPGWNTEDIRPGELAGDQLSLELVKTKAPEGGAVEVFQDQAVQRLPGQLADRPHRGDHLVPARLGEQRAVVAMAQVLVVPAQVDHLDPLAGVVVDGQFQVFLGSDHILAGVIGRPVFLAFHDDEQLAHDTSRGDSETMAHSEPACRRTHPGQYSAGVPCETAL